MTEPPLKKRQTTAVLLYAFMLPVYQMKQQPTNIVHHTDVKEIDDGFKTL